MRKINKNKEIIIINKDKDKVIKETIIASLIII